jgi:hypothetical protein
VQRAWFLLVLAALGAAAPAAAESLPATRWFGDNVYVALGAEVRVSRFGRFNVLNEALTPAFATQLDVAPSVVAAGPAGTVGVVIHDTPLLRRVRVEFAGAYRTGSAKFSAQPYSIATAFGPSALFALLSIDGQQGLLFGATPFEDGVARLKVDARLLAGAVRLRGDVELGALTITPFLGVVAESARQRYTLDFRLTGAGVDYHYNLDETVRLRRLGGEAGADLVLRLGEGIALHGGASFAYVHQGARFAGSDCFTATIFAGGAPCGAWATSVAFTDSRMAWRSDVGLGLGATAGRVTFAARGFGRFDSAVPGIRNPVATQAIFLGGAARPGPAALYYSGQWSYGGLLTATIALR